MLSLFDFINHISYIGTTMYNSRLRAMIVPEIIIKTANLGDT